MEKIENNHKEQELAHKNVNQPSALGNSRSASKDKELQHRRSSKRFNKVGSSVNQFSDFKERQSRYEREELDSMDSLKGELRRQKTVGQDSIEGVKLIARLKSCKTFLRQVLDSNWLRYFLLTILILNMAVLVSAYIVTQYFSVNLQQYLDFVFKLFDSFYALEIVCKLLAYVFLESQKWKYLKNKIFLMEVVIGAFHILDLVFWEPNKATRVLRLFFVLRLLTLFKSLQNFTKYILQSMATELEGFRHPHSVAVIDPGTGSYIGVLLHDLCRSFRDRNGAARYQRYLSLSVDSPR